MFTPKERFTAILYDRLGNTMPVETRQRIVQVLVDAHMVMLDRALAAQRRQIAEDIEDDRVRHTGTVSLAFYAGMERAAAVVKNDIKAGA